MTRWSPGRETVLLFVLMYKQSLYTAVTSVAMSLFDYLRSNVVEARV